MLTFTALFVLSIGQFVLLYYNFFYIFTFALMPRGHILSDRSVRKYAKNAFSQQDNTKCGRTVVWRVVCSLLCLLLKLICFFVR